MPKEETAQCHIQAVWPLGYKFVCVCVCVFNSAEHENFSANKYENANNSWHFHIY